MLCCIEKSTKIVPTCFRKQVSNRCSKLHQFYNQLSSILGWCWLPFWLQVAPKLLKTSIAKLFKKKRCHVVEIFCRLLVDFGTKLDPNLGRKRFVMLTYVGFWGHLGAKMAPGAPKRPSGSILDRFWTDVQQFFEHFSGIGDRFLSSLVIIFRSISGLFVCWFTG